MADTLLKIFIYCMYTKLLHVVCCMRRWHIVLTHLCHDFFQEINSQAGFVLCRLPLSTVQFEEQIISVWRGWTHDHEPVSGMHTSLFSTQISIGDQIVMSEIN